MVYCPYNYLVNLLLMTTLGSLPSLVVSQPLTCHTAYDNNKPNLVSTFLTLSYHALYYTHFHFLENRPRFLLDYSTDILCHFTDSCFLIISNLGTDCKEDTAPNGAFVCCHRQMLTAPLASSGHIDNTMFSIPMCLFVTMDMCLPCHCLAMPRSLCSSILASSCHATMFFVSTSGSHGNEHKSNCHLGCDGV
jgi:hypothetical protein